MANVTQTEYLGELSVTYQFESYEDFLDFKKKQREQEAVDQAQSANQIVDPLPTLYKLLESAAKIGDTETISAASQAIQRLII